MARCTSLAVMMQMLTPRPQCRSIIQPPTRGLWRRRFLLRLIITPQPWRGENFTASARAQERRLFTIQTVTRGLPELPAITCTAELPQSEYSIKEFMLLTWRAHPTNDSR